ncbi:hypothetical protein GKQ23_13810 [Erwinia sp. E602]|uniref:hypothetical protein n=1 Tax=Erwinia sp. E602 TaxID=2675378 RepID=UPI001BA6CC92|nr:hypothetical protein [Erwinia sp. E602]QUG76007.1 hypothetical protein GKQ23_13810 [Erwinia sp. E602]
MTEKYYVAGCVDNGLDVDQVEDQDAEFWTLYAREANGESEWLADFSDRSSAEAVMAVYAERDALSEQVRVLALQDSPGKVYQIRKLDGSEEWQQWEEVDEGEYHASVSSEGWEHRILFGLPGGCDG